MFICTATWITLAVHSFTTPQLIIEGPMIMRKADIERIFLIPVGGEDDRPFPVVQLKSTGEWIYLRRSHEVERVAECLAEE